MSEASGRHGERSAHGETAAVRSLRRTSRGGALALASFGALLAFLDATIVNVVFPDIRQSFPTSSIGALSWVLNAYNIVFAAFLVAAGRLADLFGRRRTFSTGIALFTAASLACAAAPSLGLLIGGRLLQAAGAALLVPASLGLVIEAFPDERRSHAVGLWGAIAAVAAGLGPPLGGALVAADGWRLAFVINLPLGLAALVATRRLLVESRAPGRRKLPDLRGAGLQAASLALVTLAIVEGGTWGWTSPGVLGSFVAGAVAGGLFVWSSRRHPSPVLDPKLLRIRTFAVANVVTLVAGIGFYAYLLNNILWLHYVWGWSLLRSGLAVAPAALVAALVAGTLGRVADRHGHRLIAVPGALVWAGAYVWYATRVGSSPHFLAEWLPGQVLSGLGVGATLPILGSAALEAVPGGRYATASAVANSARQLGGVLGVSVLVVLIGTPAAATLQHHLRHGWLFSAACFVLVAAGSVLLGRERAQVSEDDGAELRPLLEQAAAEPLAVLRPRAEPSLLEQLPETARERLLAAAEPRALPAGEWLFRQGDPPDALYLVAAGRLEVVSAGERLADLGAGALVGELGVLAGTPRGAGVRARRDSHLLRVSATAFVGLLEEDGAARQALTARLAVQLQRSRARDPTPAPAPRVVSVLGLGGVPLERLTALLAEGMGGRLRVASPGRVDAEALDRLEREHDRVLLVAGASDEQPWRDFCLRQADRLLVVAASGDRPPPLAPDCPCEVLLVGAPPARERLVEWHDAVDARRVVRVASDADLAAAVERIAARLAGRSLGLALAGGGARALAAIGVLAELDRAGLHVERVAGASVGAVVAALHATGRSPAEIDADCYEEFVRRNPLGDYGLPRVALSRGRRLESALVRRLGELHFEELPRQLAIVSTNLLERSTVVHRRGRVRDALRASIALPGLVPPARLGAELHVDGGLLDNLPAGVLAADEGPILAVNIAAGGSSGRRAGPPRMPALPETLMRSLLIGGAGAHAAAREHAALVVTPDTRGIGLLEFHQLDRAIEAGRAAGAAAVEALAPLLA